jgi:hypothetical protein
MVLASPKNGKIHTPESAKLIWFRAQLHNLSFTQFILRRKTSCLLIKVLEFFWKMYSIRSKISVGDRHLFPIRGSSTFQTHISISSWLVCCTSTLRCIIYIYFTSCNTSSEAEHFSMILDQVVVTSHPSMIRKRLVILPLITVSAHIVVNLPITIWSK